MTFLKSASVRKAVPYVSVVLFTTLYCLPFTRVFIRSGDEGTLIYGAVRVTEGQVPFRDFFEVMGPGTFYWLAAFFKLLGTTWFATRMSVVVNAVLTTILLYHLARRLHVRITLAPAVLMMAASFPHWMSISHHGDSNTFALLSFSVFLSWLDHPRRATLVASGFLAGLTTCFLQPKGLLLIFSYIGVILLVRRPRATSAILQLAIGYGTVGITVILLFWGAGGLSELIYANIVWPITRYSGVNDVPYGFAAGTFYWDSWTSALTQTFSPVIGYGVASVLFVPLAVVLGLPLLLLAIAASNRSVAFNQSTLPYWLAGIALWASECHRKDIRHLVWGSPLLLVLCFYVFEQLRSRYAVSALRVVTGCSVLLCLFNLLTVSAADKPLAFRRGNAYGFQTDKALEFLEQNTSPGEEIFVYPYHPMYYFLAALKNPTRFSILMYGINTDAQIREAVRTLEDRQVRYVLWDTVAEGNQLKQWFPKYTQPPGEELIMEPYLLQHFEVVGLRSGFRVLRRKM